MQVPFTNQTSVTVNHNFGHYPLCQCLDSNGNIFQPMTVMNNSINEMTFTFESAKSGTIILLAVRLVKSS